MQKIAIAVAVTLLVGPGSAFAWGDKGHAISSEAATLTLPNDMPQFFYEAFPQLIWLANDPDRWKGAGPSASDASEPDHYINYEYVASLDLPPQRYRFIDLLATTRTLRRYGIHLNTIGFLPWRVTELCERLTNDWRQWRAGIPNTSERRAIEADIIHDAGILGHYVEDTANPLHDTLNYNGWVTPNPDGYANDCTIHARFESDFVIHAVDTPDVVPRIAAPRLRTDYFATELAFVRASNALVERVYQIDKAGGFDTMRPVDPGAKAFAADRIAAGASLLRDLWWSTWRNSANPPSASRR